MESVSKLAFSAMGEELAPGDGIGARRLANRLVHVALDRRELGALAIYDEDVVRLEMHDVAGTDFIDLLKSFARTEIAVKHVGRRVSGHRGALKATCVAEDRRKHLSPWAPRPESVFRHHLLCASVVFGLRLHRRVLLEEDKHKRILLPAAL